MTTLVACIDRAGDLVGDADPPVVGREAVESLVVDVGVTDPEDSQVNCLLEGLRVAGDLESEGDEAVVAVLSGTADAVGADRAIASQVEGLTDDLHDGEFDLTVRHREDMSDRFTRLIEEM